VRKGHAAIGIPADLASAEAASELVEGAQTKLGPIDILINITGGPPPSAVVTPRATDWERHFRAMVLSVIEITNLVLPSMRERKWGRIITSASSGVVVPIPDLGVSNSLRSALVGWSKTLATEVAPDSVTVNVVVPGRIATNRIRQLDESRAARNGRPVEEIVRASSATIPMRRYGEPQEYADVVAFLASERASYVTGSIVRVDGGLIGST
jgi:3-oxoacyl-[acyl-carrier protein] reductase